MLSRLYRRRRDPPRRPVQPAHGRPDGGRFRAEFKLLAALLNHYEPCTIVAPADDSENLDQPIWRQPDEARCEVFENLVIGKLQHKLALAVGADDQASVLVRMLSAVSQAVDRTCVLSSCNRFSERV